MGNQTSAKKSALGDELPAPVVGRVRRASFVRPKLSAKIIESRVLRVFLSSTFRDMQMERDAFFRTIVPQLEEKARLLKLQLVFIDLRWGLTKEDSSNGLVVIRCCDSIKKCPYFVCFLGSRYGWIPNHTDPTQWHPTTPELYPFTLEYPPLSVTDYEIIYASFGEKPACDRAFFYFRDYESAINWKSDPAFQELMSPLGKEDAALQEELKKKIQIRFGSKVYRSIDEYIQHIKEDLEAAISEDFKTEDETDEEDRTRLQFVNSKVFAAIQREEFMSQVFRHLEEQLSKEDTSFIVITSPSGYGKSTAMSLLSQSLVSSAMCDFVVAEFIGCTPGSNTVESLITQFWRRYNNETLHKNVNIDQSFIEESVKKGIHGLFRKISQEHGSKKVIFLIDGVDLILESEGYPNPHLLSWLPKHIPKNLAVVVSSRPGTEVLKHALSIGAVEINIPELSATEVKSVASKFLSEFDKQLTEPQLELLVTGTQSTSIPIYLKVALDELRTFGEFSHLDTEIRNVLSTEKLHDLYNLILLRWEKQYGDILVRVSLSAMALTRLGFSEKELLEYTRHRLKDSFNMSDWISFFFKVIDSFHLLNGRYVVAHETFSEVLKGRYLSIEYHLEEYQEYVNWKMLTKPELLNPDEIEEICFSLYTMKKSEQLLSYVSLDAVVTAILQSKHRYEFFKYWKYLRAERHDPRTAYANIIHAPGTTGLEIIKYFIDNGQHERAVTCLETRIREINNEDVVDEEEHQLGRAYHFLGKIEEASEHYKKSVDVRKRLYGEGCYEIVPTLNNIAAIFRTKKEYESAISTLDTSVEIQEKYDKVHHPNMVATFVGYGNTYFAMGRFDVALDYHLKSLDTQLHLLDDDHPNVALTYHNIASCHDELGRYQDAITFYERSLSIRKAQLGPNHPHTRATERQLATNRLRART